MPKIRTIISATMTISLLLVALAACGGSAGNPVPTGTPNLAQVQPTDTAMALATSTTANVQSAATITVGASPMPGQPTATLNYPPDTEAAVAAAKYQLAKTLGISAEQISVVEVTARVWTEMGFECPASMGITKLNIPGYRIMLKVKNTTYEYHTNQDGSVVRACTSGSGSTGSGAGASAGAGSSAGSAGGGMTQDQIIAAAKKDLAVRLGADEASIIVKSVAEQQWRDSGLGCGKGINLQVITPGYLIVLTAKGADYEYHTDMNGRLVLCVNGEPAK